MMLDLILEVHRLLLVKSQSGNTQQVGHALKFDQLKHLERCFVLEVALINQQCFQHIQLKRLLYFLLLVPRSGPWSTGTKQRKHTGGFKWATKNIENLVLNRPQRVLNCFKSF